MACRAGMMMRIIKQLLDEVFRDIQNYQGRGKCYQLKPKAETDGDARRKF